MSDRYEELYDRAYIVLKSEPWVRSDPFAIPRAGSRDLSESLDLSIERMSERDVRRRTRDISVQAIAPVMPMQLIKPLATPVTSQNTGASTWGVEAVGAMTSPFTGKDITVAVLDTGIHKAHPAFANKRIIERDFTGEGDGDTDGHGTHCAGTICGENSPLRIGVAPGVKDLLIGKVLASDGGATSWIAEAIRWAVSSGANIISMSLGIDFPGYVDLLHRRGGMPIPAATSVALQGYRATVRLMDNLAQGLIAQQPFQPQGTMVVAASGNESARSGNPAFTIAAAPPANADGFIAVGAVGKSNNEFHIADFSNTGAQVVAPGENIISAWNDGTLQALDGTSMATPHVAGVAALWAEKLLINTGRIDSLELQARLMGTAVLPQGMAPDDAGSGLVRAPQS